MSATVAARKDTCRERASESQDKAARREARASSRASQWEEYKWTAVKRENQSRDRTQICHLRSNQSARVPPIRVEVKLDDCLTTMEVDTGVSLSLMSHATVQGLWPGRSLEPTDVRLLSYSKDPIPVLGCT